MIDASEYSTPPVPAVDSSHHRINAFARRTVGLRVRERTARLRESEERFRLLIARDKDYWHYWRKYLPGGSRVILDK